MALLQDILQQLQGMGFGEQSYMGIADIQPGQISQQLQGYFGLQEEDIPAHMFQGISSDLLRSGLGSTYSPQIQAKGSSLLGGLQETMGGKQATAAAGGFAGSGQQQQFSQSAKDVYGKGMTDVLAQTGQQRLGGLQNVQNIINQWRDTALRIKGQ
mgnify:CR=1 FL=1